MIANDPALYMLVSLLSCGFGAISTAVAFLAFAYYANRRAPVSPSAEIDPSILAEVLAEKLALQALADKAERVK